MLKKLLKRLFGFKENTSNERGAISGVVEELISDPLPIPVEDVVDVADTLSRTGYIQCASPSGLHKMAYHEWGNSDNPNVLICVHGLTRRGSDFTVLARARANTVKSLPRRVNP